MPERLADELPRILRWMIDGAAAYWEDGRLVNCAAVDEASQSYFEMHATFEAWLEECCYIDPAYEERAKFLYANFKKWKEERGEGVPSQSAVGRTHGSTISAADVWRDDLVWLETAAVRRSVTPVTLSLLPTSHARARDTPEQGNPYNPYNSRNEECPTRDPQDARGVMKHTALRRSR